MLESTLQSKVIKYLSSKNDIYWFKTVSSNRRGIPDIIVCYKGVFIAIELKSIKGKVSMLQKIEEERIIKCNGYYILASSYEVFLQQFSYILDIIDGFLASGIRMINEYQNNSTTTY